MQGEGGGGCGGCGGCAWSLWQLCEYYCDIYEYRRNTTPGLLSRRFRTSCGETCGSMEGRLSRPGGPEWDEEGFPIATLCGVGETWQIEQDEESGEWIQHQVFILRHQSMEPRPRLVREVMHIHWPLLQRGPLIQEYAHNGDVLRAQHNSHTRRQPRNPAHHNDIETLKSRPMFQVPKMIFQELPQNDPSNGGTRLFYITIWKEFIYAPSVLMLERQHLTFQELHGIKPVTCRLSKFVNRKVVDWSLYVFFFGVYFLHCCIFHDLLELGLYLLFGSHLSIHHLANCSNIDVAFKGSFFQGPAYALIRMCCQHCAQKENAAVMWRHMAKMKKDIMNANVT